MIGQLGNYKSILLLLILLLFPVINLWNLPLSEDTGFYTYLSRAVMHGATLHNDIPVSTNSLAIYWMAEFFRIFGSSVNVYNFFHLIFCMGLVVVFKLTKTSSLDYVVGGAVSIATLASLQEIQSHYLTRYQTRKIVFHADSLIQENIDGGLSKAVHFELLWLLKKREYYKVITKEDDERIEMLQLRWSVFSQEGLN